MPPVDYSPSIVGKQQKLFQACFNSELLCAVVTASSETAPVLPEPESVARVPARFASQPAALPEPQA
jgi:hypothetical protein